MRKREIFKCFLFLIVLMFFMSFNVKADEKCSDEKINQLKKQVEKVSMVSNFDDDAAKDGAMDANVVTLYDLPKGFFARNKDQSILLDYSDENGGTISETMGSKFSSVFYIYSKECPNQPLKTINLELKKINTYYNSEECKGIKEGELDVCEKFYDKDISYDTFLRKVNNYKNKHNIKSTSDSKESFLEKNRVLILAVVAIAVVVAIIVVINNIKKNKLD